MILLTGSHRTMVRTVELLREAAGTYNLNWYAQPADPIHKETLDGE